MYSCFFPYSSWTGYNTDASISTQNGLDCAPSATDVPCRAKWTLAWLMARPGVTAPIASVTSRSQLDSLVAATHLSLSAEQIAVLDQASN